MQKRCNGETCFEKILKIIELNHWIKSVNIVYYDYNLSFKNYKMHLNSHDINFFLPVVKMVDTKLWLLVF